MRFIRERRPGAVWREMSPEDRRHYIADTSSFDVVDGPPDMFSSASPSPQPSPAAPIAC
jgi:hypothetical protein